MGQPLLQTLPQITFELGAVDNSDEYTPADNAPFEATVEEIVDGPFEGTEEEQVDLPSEVAEEEEVEALLQVMDEELDQVAPVSRLTSVIHGHVYRHSVFSEDLSRFQKNSEAGGIISGRKLGTRSRSPAAIIVRERVGLLALVGGLT